MRYLPWVILTNVASALLAVVVINSAIGSAIATFGADYGVTNFAIMNTPVTLGMVVALVGGAAVFGYMTRVERVMTFTHEVIGELARVTWPTRDEVVKASVTVVGTTAFTAALLAGFDYLWKNVADYVFFNPTVSRYIVNLLS